MTEHVRPYLVVLARVLPGLDGAEVYRLMRERDGFAEVPVLIISALEARSDDALRGRHAHLTTPFDVQALLDTVRPLLAAR